ncbi:hypothetical protein ABFA07_009879 [Porites harrisoni]
MTILNGFAICLVTFFAVVHTEEVYREQCSQISDVVFVVDSSGSIGRRNFKRELQFVKQVASTFKMGPKQSQIAVISYSDDAKVDIRFGEYSNVNDFNAAVDLVKHQRQRTRIDKALHLANTQVFTQDGGARSGIAKVMVILTDGKQTVTSDSKTLDVAVRPLQEKNVTVFAVGVGKAIDITELLLLVGGNGDNLFRAENFDELTKHSLQLAAQTCKRIKPPAVHGNWSEWADWGACSQSCGTGVQGRRRTCTNPTPRYGGRDCVGVATEIQNCNLGGCPVNGSWSEWSDWGSCGVTCGGGNRKRSRTCTNPSPANGGLECPGASEETEKCNSSPCPVDGKWGAWVEWNVCSTSCGLGTQRRFRSCNKPRPAFGGRECTGPKDETRNCSQGSCPVDGHWGAWEEWDFCTESCGGGVQKRIRTCNNPPPANGGQDCRGTQKQSQRCNIQACPIDGQWSKWIDWSACSRTCGIGQKRRSRTCTDPPPAHGDKKCAGKAHETKECSNRICPVDGQWSDWRDWEPCSTTCGAGNQQRTRSCTKPHPAFGGKECVGPSRESRSCQGIPCPVDGEWSEWRDWEPCSRTCGTGTQQRLRSCTRPRPAFGGRDCVGNSRETKTCETRACPVDGDWSNWNKWTACSKTCGEGTQIRIRTCDDPKPLHGGKQCEGAAQEARVCNTRKCPVNGQWSGWKPWSGCTRSCGSGIQTRARTCTNPSPAHGGQDCVGLGDETRPCNNKPCPVDGQWTAWKPWTECTRSCDSGIQTRARTCTNPSPAYGGKDCVGLRDEIRPCNKNPCPVDGNWSEWKGWGECSLSCGGGYHSRSRSCTNPSPRHGGKDCSGENNQTRPCNTQSCPVDGQWSNWIKWTTCSKTCGKGEQTRTRNCTNPAPRHGGKQCTGHAQETQNCNIKSCADCSEIADIAFLVDASESMTVKDFATQKDVIKKIAATFDVGPTKSHLGLMTFSSHAQVRVKFRDNLDMRSFQETVDKLPFAAGGTRFDKAFEEAAKNLFSPSGGVRSHLPKIFVILTDGKQSADYDAVPIEQSMLQLRHLGVRILTLAVGSQVDMNELLQIVNEPKDIYAVKDFDTLLGNTDEVGKLTCGIVKRSELLCVEKADIAFLMDASESMTEDDFEKQKNFVIKVAESFYMAPKTTQFALVTYSSTATMHIRFKDHFKRDSFNAVVKGLPFAAGGTRFDRALKLAAEEVFTAKGGTRVGVPKVMIILTDGRQSNDYDAVPIQDAVLPLRQRSVQIHAVAIELYLLTE